MFTQFDKLIKFSTSLDIKSFFYRRWSNMMEKIPRPNCKDFACFENLPYIFNRTFCRDLGGLPLCESNLDVELFHPRSFSSANLVPQTPSFERISEWF